MLSAGGCVITKKCYHEDMNKVINIPNPKTLMKEKNLVLIPRKEYEHLRRLSSRAVPEIKLTNTQEKAIRESERELKRGDYLTLAEIEHELGGSRTQTGK